MNVGTVPEVSEATCIIQIKCVNCGKQYVQTAFPSKVVEL